MYHVAMGISDDSEHLADKIEMVEGLPSAGESVRVTLLYVHGDEETIDDASAVTAARERLSATGIEVTTQVVASDDPVEGLCEAFDELDVDLVCVGGRQRTPAGKRGLKPGAQEILLQTNCPVVIAGKLDEQGPRT